MSYVLCCRQLVVQRDCPEGAGELGHSTWEFEVTVVLAELSQCERGVAVRKEIAEYRRTHYSAPALRIYEITDRVLYHTGSVLGRLTREGSPAWHRTAHLLSLIPSLSGSIELRAGFMRASMGGVSSHCVVLQGLFITYPSNITIGDRVFINRNVFINAMAPIRIGSDVLIGPNVVINSANHSFSRLDVPINKQPHELDPITINDDVWVGANCVITAGVTIGEGCVVGAGSVVTRSLPPGVVAAGTPARIIKKRKGVVAAK